MKVCPGCGAEGPHKRVKLGFDGKVRGFMVLPKRGENVGV